MQLYLLQCLRLVEVEKQKQFNIKEVGLLMKIAKMVMKGPQRGYPGMIHRETQMQTFQFERNPSCGCCMSCT